jgi:hypothetical protein
LTTLLTGLSQTLKMSYVGCYKVGRQDWGKQWQKRWPLGKEGGIPITGLCWLWLHISKGISMCRVCATAVQTLGESGAGERQIWEETAGIKFITQF